ncbi:MAG: cell division protein FtsZ [Candidatus Micrarchaeia archaeon]|jgi:cell division protein FtsZ
MATDEDEELIKFIEASKPKIYVIGIGGSGCNTMNRLYQLGISGATLIAANTDAAHLLKIKAQRKIILGKKTTKGLGAGSDPSLGEEAAKETLPEIKKEIEDAQMVFLTCGLGGGTGSGGIPIIAQGAKELGALVVAVVTLPFSSEGKVRRKNALEALEKLRKYVDTLILIQNDKLLSVAPNLPLNTAFRVADEVLANAAKGVIEMVTKPGMVNLDFADLKSVLRNAGFAMIATGEAIGNEEERALTALQNALKSPLLDIDISQAKRALVNIIGGEDLTLKEAERVIKEISNNISEEALLKWGARIEQDAKKGSVRVMIVVSGIEPKIDFRKELEKAKEESLELDEIFEE